MCQVSKSNKLLSFEQVARADLIGLIMALLSRDVGFGVWAN